MKKIIHLSDLHVGYDTCSNNFQIIVNNIISRQQPASSYIVLITGDLVDKATHSELYPQALAYINQLKEAGFLVLVVPGNHDYGSGSWANPEFVSLFKQTFYNNTSITYPKIDIIDEVLFIGLDSTADELHWYDRILAQGEIGKDQLGRLKEILDNSAYQTYKKVVYLHHHPFDFKFGLQLKDSKKLKKIIQNRVDALLFGHLHNDKDSAGQSFNGCWGITRAYNAGSATHKCGNAGHHRIIDLSASPFADTEANFLL